MVSQDERAKYEAMNMQERGKWLKDHLEEIIADIRSMPKRKVYAKWPFGQSTLFKLIKLHTPELIKKPRTEPRRRKAEKPPVTSKEAPSLTEHERYLILVGYQMATREFLEARGS